MATKPRPLWKSIAPGAGLFLGLGKYGQLVTKLAGVIKNLSQPAIDCTISFTAAVASARTVTVQLLDRNGVAIDYVEAIELVMHLASDGSTYAATGGTTGIATGSAGKVLAIVAKKIFDARTDATGKLVVTYTDTAAEVVYLGVVLPNGREVMGAVMTTS